MHQILMDLQNRYGLNEINIYYLNEIVEFSL